MREREDPLNRNGADLESPFFTEEIDQAEAEHHPDVSAQVQEESGWRTAPEDSQFEAVKFGAASDDEYEEEGADVAEHDHFHGGVADESGNTGIAVIAAEDEAPTPTTLRMRKASDSPVKARILWPALGFPAVIAPRENGPADPLDADATRCLCVLILSNKTHLSKEEAARYLRIVPWSERTTRQIASGVKGSFSVEDVQVRNNATRNQLTMPQKDALADAVVFGGDRRDQDNRTIIVSLARRVRDFYKKQGLEHLHEIRVSEQASARLAPGQYHLFWNGEAPRADGISDEMQLLVEGFATPRRKGLGAKWAKHLAFLLKEYTVDYGALHPPYQQVDKNERLTEVLHPVFIKQQTGNLRIGHVTDTHVDVRADVYEENLKTHGKPIHWNNRHLFYNGAPFSYNNFNKDFVEIYDEVKKNSDVILLTGDLIDYGRGHVGLALNGEFRKKLGDDDTYHHDRNWFLFYYLLASGDNYKIPAYTILGNHDWRLTPYPPFAPGAPDPRALVHNSKDFKGDAPLKDILRIAHGPGADEKGYAYIFDTNSKLGLFFRAIGRAVRKKKLPTFKLDSPGSPLHTTVESVAWYLLLINPFLDYAFELPSGQQILMLDWAENEEVFNTNEPRTWAGFGPRAADSLTPLQKWHVDEFAGLTGKAKVIGIHAPPVGPYPEWSDTELLNGLKVYASGVDSRARKPDGTIVKLLKHSLFAIRPEREPYGIAADHGSLAKEKERNWFIQKVADQKSGVRLVLAGHNHRNGLLVVRAVAKNWLIRAVNYKDSRGIKPPGVATWPNSPARFVGPLYVNTTSAGPRGNQYEAGHRYVSPGYAIISLASDGTIENVSPRQIIPPALPVPVARAVGSP